MDQWLPRILAIGYLALWFFGLWIGGFASPLAPGGFLTLGFGTIIFGSLTIVIPVGILWILKMFDVIATLPWALDRKLNGDDRR
ncbi:MAG: hypothetical protein RLZZ501_768 [Pseudomonadota bacterium]|jgi:hypothetical protein